MTFRYYQPTTLLDVCEYVQIPNYVKVVRFQDGILKKKKKRRGRKEEKEGEGE